MIISVWIQFNEVIPSWIPKFSISSQVITKSNNFIIARKENQNSTCVQDWLLSLYGEIDGVINTCKYSLLKWLGQFSYNGIGSELHVSAKCDNSQLLVPLSYDPSVVTQIRLLVLRSVCLSACLSVCQLCLCHE